MIRYNVFVVVDEKTREEVIALAKELVAETVKEEGCVAYDFFESTTRSNVLMFCETWKDAQALKSPGESAHLTTILPKIEALASTVKLESFEF